MNGIRTIPHSLIDPVGPSEDVTIRVSLPARYAAELDRLAADVDTTASDWARSALLEVIDPHSTLREYQHTSEEADLDQVPAELRMGAPACLTLG